MTVLKNFESIDLKSDFENFKSDISKKISLLEKVSINDSARLDCLQKDFFTLSNSISNLQKSNELISNSLNTLLNRFNLSLEKSLELDKSVKSVRSDFDNICFSNQMLKISFEDIKRDSNSSSELFKKEIDDINVALENLGSNITSKFDVFKESIDYVRNQSNFISKDIINLKETAFETNKINLEAINKCVSDFDFLRGFVNTKFDRLSHEIEVFHQDLDGVNECLNKKEDCSDDDKMQLNLINELKKAFESLKLDVQNTNLRTANSSTQIQMIEKKIENIFLQLKKIELDKA